MDVRWQDNLYQQLNIGEHSVCLLCVGCITSLSCTVLLPHGEEKEK